MDVVEPTTDEQAELALRTKDAYEKELLSRGFNPITTEIGPAEGLPFYYAEDYHQQYLAPTKNPNGYCGLGGTIEVEHSDTTGTSFVVELPISREPV